MEPDDKQGVPFGRYMTGQMFYDRFEQQLKGRAFFHGPRDDKDYVAVAVQECIDAARKAAGLE